MIAVDHATHGAGLERARAPARVGSLAELLLVGGLTPLFFLLSGWLRRTFGLDGPEYAFGFATFYAAFVVNDPHFTVTYCLFYRKLGERDCARRPRTRGNARATWRPEC